MFDLFYLRSKLELKRIESRTFLFWMGVYLQPHSSIHGYERIYLSLKPNQALFVFGQQTIYNTTL